MALRAAASVARQSLAWCPAAPGLRHCTSAAAGSQVLFAKDAETGIATVTLNAPSKLNALTVEMGDEFYALVKRIKDDMADVRAIVVTGAGSAFSAGGDLQFLRDRCADTPSRNAAIMRKFYARFLSVRELPVPVVAAVNGHAIGAGLAFALACDYRVVSEKALLGVTFTQLGLHPGMGSSHFLPRLIGFEAASHMLVSGSKIKGDQAAKLGMALHSTAPDAVLPKAVEVAAAVSSASPVAVRGAIRTLRNQQEVGLEQALWREADAQAQCYASSDMVEGLAALTEKRPPVFTNFEGYAEALQR